MPSIAGVIAAGTVLQSPASLPVATRVATVTTAGVMELPAAADVRTLLGLGTAAVESAGAFDAAGAAAAAYSAAGSDLSTHASDTTLVHGIADTSALVLTSDSRLSDARTPTAHTHPASEISDSTAAGRSLLTAADAAAQRIALALVIGTDVQAHDADLSALAALSGTNTIYYRSGAATWSAVTIGSGLDFTTGTLSATGGGGTPGGSSGQVQYNNAGAFGGAAGLAWSTSSPNVTVRSQGAAHVPLRIVGAASQTAGYLECRNSSSTLGPWISSATAGGGDVAGALRFGSLGAAVSWFSTDWIALGGGNGTLCNHAICWGTSQSYASRLTTSGDITAGTATGMKIGTGTTQKLGFWNATPVVQPASANQAAITDTAGATYTAAEQTMLANLQTLVNQLRSDLVTIGIIKGAA